MVSSRDLKNKGLEVGSASGLKKPGRKPGTTCHQCRQKITTSSARCTKMKTVDKRCSMKYCDNCLRNRYGETVEEAVLSEDWECPKCRYTCNCSCCMRNQGRDPTGRLKLSEIITEHMVTMDVSPARVKRARKPNSGALALAIIPAVEEERAPPISLTPEAQQEQAQTQAMTLTPETEQETTPYPNNEDEFPILDVRPWDEVHDLDDDIFECCDDIANLGDL